MKAEGILNPDNLPPDVLGLTEAIYGELPHGMTEVYDHLIIHCSATPPSMTEVDAGWIDRAHRRRGWTQNGYNAVITRDGHVQHAPNGYRCRPYGKTGAHVGNCGPGWNARSVGVVYAGGVSEEDGETPEGNINQQQEAALLAYINAVAAAFEIPHRNIIGHRDLIKKTKAPPKACPSFSVREWLVPSFLDGDYSGRKDYAVRKGESVTAIPQSYQIEEGDTLWDISNRFGVPLRTIRKLNDMAPNETTIKTGEELVLLRKK